MLDKIEKVCYNRYFFIGYTTQDYEQRKMTINKPYDYYLPFHVSVLYTT